MPVGYSHYDTHNAINVTGALFRGQWRNGASLRIIFDPSAVESCFLGPKFGCNDTAGKAGPNDALFM